MRDDGASVKRPQAPGRRPVVDRGILEGLYAKFNRREFVHPDPLEFLYRYDAPDDREVVGLVASTLAYGRVRQILKSVEDALGRMGDRPADFVRGSSSRSLRSAFAGFRHRFTTGADLSSVLDGVRAVLAEHGTLGAFFAGLVAEDDATVVPALTTFVGAVAAPWTAAGARGGRARGRRKSGGLGGRRETGPGGGRGGACPLPDPARGSACKRLHLYLRWMVRRDDVDPGGWEGVSASKLVVPLDTHMHRLSRLLGLTKRKQADLRTALEITEAFRAFSPDDPVRYDFALTRLGIRDDLSEEALLLRRAVGDAT